MSVGVIRRPRRLEEPDHFEDFHSLQRVSGRLDFACVVDAHGHHAGGNTPRRYALEAGKIAELGQFVLSCMERLAGLSNPNLIRLVCEDIDREVGARPRL